MRTPVGSSKMVARSRAHSSPACDPSGVTLTFWAHAADAAATTARNIARAAKCFMAPPWGERADEPSMIGAGFPALTRLDCNPGGADSAADEPGRSWVSVTGLILVPREAGGRTSFPAPGRTSRRWSRRAHG